MTKKVIIIVLVFLLVLAAGCSYPKVKVDISSPIEFYSPSMSSVPGLPIDVNVNVKSDKPYELSIELTTDNGTLLEWGNDMIVKDKGKSIMYQEGTRYWSPFDVNHGIATGAEIDVIVTVSGSGFDSVTRMNVKIIKDDDDMFSLNEGN